MRHQAAAAHYLSTRASLEYCWSRRQQALFCFVRSLSEPSGFKLDGHHVCVRILFGPQAGQLVHEVDEVHLVNCSTKKRLRWFRTRCAGSAKHSRGPAPGLRLESFAAQLQFCWAHSPVKQASELVLRGRGQLSPEVEVVAHDVRFDNAHKRAQPHCCSAEARRSSLMGVTERQRTLPYSAPVRVYVLREPSYFFFHCANSSSSAASFSSASGPVAAPHSLRRGGSGLYVCPTHPHNTKAIITGCHEP